MRILVIDDDTGMTDLLRILLTPAFTDVSIANTAQDGLRLARDLAPEIIIVDLLLPDMHGWQVCQAIRKFSLAPILILSAVANPDLVAEALENGADDYMTKPVTSLTLIAHLNMLSRRQPSTELTLKFAHQAG